MLAAMFTFASSYKSVRELFRPLQRSGVGAKSARVQDQLGDEVGIII